MTMNTPGEDAPPTATTTVYDKEAAMSLGVESLFTSALGLKAPWEVGTVELDTAKRRIDFEVAC